MDYEGLYRDLVEIAKEASHRAAMWLEFDRGLAMERLEFAAECEKFAGELFLRGRGGY